MKRGQLAGDPGGPGAQEHLHHPDLHPHCKRGREEGYVLTAISYIDCIHPAREAGPECSTRWLLLWLKNAVGGVIRII